MQKTMLIAHISDTHIAAPTEKTFGVAPMAENLVAVVEHINGLNPKPDMVVLSGDVMNDARRDQAERAAHILAGLTCPLYVLPGNHDARDVLWDVFGAACPSQTPDFINYVIDGHALRVICLDTVKPGEAGGQLCAPRLDWLRDCLKDGGDQPTVIFMHHPPLKLGVQETDIDGFEGADALGEIVAAYPNIERILCGHIHLQTHSRWHGAIVTTAPSIGMQLALDLTQTKQSRFLLSDPAYLLHHWSVDQTLVTHTIQVSNPEGPFDFDVV